MGINIMKDGCFVIPKNVKHLKIVTDIKIKKDIDIDVFALLINEDKEIYETICYQNENTHGIKLESNTHTLDINFNEVKEYLKGFMLCLSIFEPKQNEEDLLSVENITIHLFDTNSNEELCHFILINRKKNFNACYIANLENHENIWRFRCIEQNMIGNICSIREQLQNHKNMKYF